MFSTKVKIILASAFLVLNINVYSQDGDEKELGWFFDAEVAGLWTGGNSQSVTYGLGATLRRVWMNSELRFDAGGTQTESSLTTRTAVGTTNNFEVKENTNKEKTAELFYARGRYDYNFSKHFYALGGIDWLRNRFAGIDSRFLIGAGVGNVWLDSDNVRFKTDYSFTYTFQSDVVENPFVKNNFPGLRFSYNFWYKLTSSTDFESILIVDWNLDNSKDVRIDFTNSLPITISEMFTLKPSLQLLWRNDPSLTEIDLFASDGTPAGEKVLVPLKKLDSFFSLALVVKL
jgi:putative salt-induced outer membrane protein YdiY